MCGVGLRDNPAGHIWLVRFISVGFRVLGGGFIFHEGVVCGSAGRSVAVARGTKGSRQMQERDASRSMHARESEIAGIGLLVQNHGLATLAMPRIGAKQPNRFGIIDGDGKSLALYNHDELASLPMAQWHP